MQPPPNQPQQTAELVPLSVIRVETALSRYPVHRLAKQGTVSIEIREKAADGEVLIKWEVSHSSRYGQPGPLAYKLDTLIVNRRIEEARRPIPKIIKLGSIHDICRELGVRGGKPRENVKKALYQNALAGISAKLRYKLANGATKELESVFTRYSVVFTGEELPDDGRKADAVYLVLNEVFMQVINGAQTRPLDYDYLKDLPPASQRLYEILSFQLYATLKNSRKDARLSYAEFCTYAPLTRFLKWDQVRPQMARIHRPHLKSGYIDSVEFVQTADRDGKPDWLMVYVPGFKARAEYRAFTKRGGPRTLEVEQSPPALVAPGATPPTPLELDLISRGVTPSTAAELVATYPEEQIRTNLELFDWVKLKHPKKIKESDGGYLASAIRGHYSANPPRGFETKADREMRQAAEDAKRRAAEAEHRRLRAERQREDDIDRQVKQLWGSLTEAEREQLEAQALDEAEPEVRAHYHETPGGASRRLLLVSIRQAYIRKLIETAPDGEQASPPVAR